MTRVTIEGQENLPTTGAYILAPVHRSYVDTPITACVTRRRIRFMGKQEVWENKRAGWLASTLGAFPVARGKADREALKHCITALEGGEPLVLFPEGERKDGPIVQPLFDGASYVAARAGVPIVPIGIGGSARVMPRHAKMIHPSKVHVIIGAPIHVERTAIRPGRPDLHRGGHRRTLVRTPTPLHRSRIPRHNADSPCDERAVHPSVRWLITGMPG